MVIVKLPFSLLFGVNEPFSTVRLVWYRETFVLWSKDWTSWYWVTGRTGQMDVHAPYENETAAAGQIRSFYLEY